MNLIEGINTEIARVEDLIDAYKEFSPSTDITVAIMLSTIEKAQHAMHSGDTCGMVYWCKELKGFKL